MGQDHVKESLNKAFIGGKLSHAYLFAGPKGSGKTSTARILAKMVNCEAEKDIPCNKCSSCISITDGSNLDLIEIDAASNRGIDDIRELREKIKLSPTSSKKKVYIIDEVHMLTTEAFNALLKTLEEPPEHVLFILATTDAQKIPQTILSRVTRLNFHQATEAELVASLKKIVAKEKIKVSDEVLFLIAKKAEGSYRDGQKILDQLAAINGEITAEVIENLFRSGRTENCLELLELISQKDTAKALELVIKLVDEGVNLKEFINSLLEILRVALLAKYSTENKNLDQGILNLSQKMSSQEIISVINNFNSALEKMKYVSILELPLEVAIIESSSNAETVSISFETKPQVKAIVEPIEEKPELIDQPPAEIPTVTANLSSSEIMILKDKWAYILETIRPYNYSLEALLKQVKILSADGADVVLEVPYAFHQRILEAPKSRNLLESVLAEVLGKPAKVSTVIGTRPILVEELANVEVAADDEIIKIASEIFNS